MPASWISKRKGITFISRPNPGAHKREYAASIIVLLRDFLGYVKNSREAKYAVKNTEILVNGRKCEDIRQPVGLFDIIELKATGESFTFIFDNIGKLKLIPAKENNLIAKVLNKSTLSGGKYQLNLFNGFNVLVSEKEFKSIKVEDSIVYDFDKKKISSHLPLKEGAFVFVYDGKFKGSFGEVKSFTEYNGVARDIVQIDFNGQVNNTAKDYCYVIGQKKGDVKRFE